MAHILWVGIGGFFGAISRYLLSAWAQRLAPGGFPLGTLAVNILGCFAIGLMMVWLDRGLLTPAMQRLLGAGFLGALTTFSTFGYETFALWRQGQIGPALASIAANLLLGLLAVWLGTLAAESWG